MSNLLILGFEISYTQTCARSNVDAARAAIDI